MDETFRKQFVGLLSIENQQLLEGRFGSERPKASKQRILKMAKPSQVRLTGEFGKRQINSCEKPPCECLSGIVEIPIKLPGNICVKQR
jgi:hypothetical protein